MNNRPPQQLTGLSVLLLVISVVAPISMAIRTGYSAWGVSGATIGLVVGLLIAAVSCGGVWALGEFVSKWFEPKCVQVFGAKGKHVSKVLLFIIMAWIAFCFVATKVAAQNIIIWIRK